MDESPAGISGPGHPAELAGQWAARHWPRGTFDQHELDMYDAYRRLTPTDRPEWELVRFRAREAWRLARAEARTRAGETRGLGVQP
jgi:hypothetical protein